MRAHIEPKLGAVQETLLIPLLGRARETAKSKGLLKDPKAVEMVEAIDYDFSKWEKKRSLSGSCVRTVMFDQRVQTFLHEHPEGTIVEIGCGLNTRFERIDNGRARWFEFDLPDVIEIRRRFFNDTERRTMMAASVMDEEWVEPVKATGGPFCLVSEAAIIYLDKPDVQKVTAALTRHFPGALLLMDTCGRWMVENQGRHDSMKHLSKDSWFRWICDDPAELEGWDPPLSLETTQTFMDADPAVRKKMPLTHRLMMTCLPFVVRPMVNQYRINAFRLVEA